MTMFLQIRTASLEEALNRLERARLASYDQIQRSVLITDVRSDAEFQRIFGGYYRVRRRSKAWRDSFYALLEREKRNAGVSFNLVLRELHEATGRIEASFASKLVATVSPDQSVYDRFVREALGLRIPSRSLQAERRLSAFALMYEELAEKAHAFTRTPEFTRLRSAFDARFRAYRYFTDVKKLDLLLWQHRKRIAVKRRVGTDRRDVPS